MPDNLRDLLEKDRDALDYYNSLPMFIRDRAGSHSEEIQTKADLSAYANQSMHDALLLDQYKPMFEDETDSDIDFV
ncbi:MAG: hypothetical protein GX647_09285 [Clostridiales bacterium]|nr:hypothetical protein [Clostridiales bacterium]